MLRREQLMHNLVSNYVVGWPAPLNKIVFSYIKKTEIWKLIVEWQDII